MNRLLKSVLSVSSGLLLAAVAANAQSAGTITGRVLTEAGGPLPSASVSISSLGVGAYTDAQGAYTIHVPAARITGQTVSLTARRVGYSPKSVQIRLTLGTVQQDFQLTANASQLTGVVVTALGVQKEQSQLGTSVTQLSSTELNGAAPTQNVVDEIGGKVAGVQVTSSGTQGGSSNIIIRGENSITGNNQPLFIVDGVAVANDDRGSNANGSGRGIDFGSTVQDINPDDIATLTVLKGPNAAALYGSRGANGVILITTKKGAATNGKIETSIMSSYTWDTPSILPTFQNQYGQGSQGQFAYVDGAGGGTNDGDDQSYGPKLDGRLIPQFDSPVINGVRQATPWIAQPDNVSSFFNTGHTFTNNLAFSGGTEKAQARLSIGDENTQGYIPNNTFHKFSGLLNGNLNVNSRLTTSASVQYVNNTAHNRPGVGYDTGILEQFTWFGRQVNMNELRATQYNPDGSLYNWNSNYHNNPFWLQYDNPEQDSRDHLIASATANYKLANWLNATLRSGSDIYRYGINQNDAAGNIEFTNLAYNGAMYQFNNNNNDNNTELLLNATGHLGGHLQLNGTLGGNRRQESYASQQASTTGLVAAGIYNLANAAIAPTVADNIQRLQTNSIYGSGSFTLNDYWTVEVTGRNDVSSTLPKGNNSYFYPSINTSLVLSDMFPALKNRVLSYAKIRGSVAEVGNDAPVYDLATTYTGNANKFAGLPQFSISNTLANASLLPEQTKSGETGLELGLFNSRITLDATYYDKATTNQIIPVTLSNTTGFTQRVINAGKMTNKGAEFSLGVTPIKTAAGFEWNSTFNYAKNVNKLVTLYPGLQTIVLGAAWTGNTEARVGYPYGVIYANGFLRDSAGNLLTSGGLPQMGPRRVLGNIQPKWTGGWSNEIRYKSFTASALIDIHKGGNILSITNMFDDNTGVTANTLVGRQVDWNNPGIVVKGIDQATGKPNTINVTAETYYQSLFEIMEPYVYDDSWVKLRELRIGVDLPDAFAHSIRSTSVNLSFVGRNLWTQTKVPNIDPEFSDQTGNYQGTEFATLPNVKSLGLNLRITP